MHVFKKNTMEGSRMQKHENHLAHAEYTTAHEIPSSTSSCFSCKKLQNQCAVCICNITYCDECSGSDHHKKVCADSFHMRVKKVIHAVERGGSIITNSGNGMSSNNLQLKCSKTSAFFKTSLFPHIKSGGISNCIACGKINDNIKFRWIRRNRSSHYYADVCSECYRNNLFICSHTYLPSDKCTNGKWRKSKLFGIAMLYGSGLIPMDVVRYIYKFMWSIDKNMCLLGGDIHKHTCTRHFDVFTNNHY